MYLKSNGYYYYSHYCDDPKDNRLRYPTGIKVSTPDADKELAKVTKIADRYITDCSHVDKPVLKSEFYAYLDSKWKPGKGKKKHYSTFMADFRQMFDNMRSGKLLKKKNRDRYTSETIQQYERILKNFIKYEEEEKLSFDYDITIDDFNRFIGWAVKKGFSRNHIANFVDLLKFFLNLMRDNGKHNNPITDSKSFSYSREKSDSIALTLKELEEMYKLQLSKRKEEARDVFVFGCFMGLRVGDLLTLLESNDYRLIDNIFEVFTKKGKKRVTIPVHPISRAIYEKYNGRLPTFATRQDFKYYLPAIAKASGMTQKKLIVTTKGGRRTEEHYHRWELVSPHSMRRTFATVMYKLGFPPKSIMLITGHSSERIFFDYIKIEEEEAVQMMLDHPFFKNPTLFSSNPSVSEESSSPPEAQ